MSTLWKSRYAQRTLGSRVPPSGNFSKSRRSRKSFHLAAAFPRPTSFPVQRFEEACHKVLTEHGPQALQYGTTEGYRPFAR